MICWVWFPEFRVLQSAHITELSWPAFCWEIELISFFWFLLREKGKSCEIFSCRGPIYKGCVLIMETDTRCILDILPSHFYSKIGRWQKNNELCMQLMLVCICVCALRSKGKERHSLFLCSCSFFLLITSLPSW